MADNSIYLPEPDADETSPYVHLGFCRAAAGREEQVEKLILGLVDPIRKEPGNVAFHVHRDRSDHRNFVIYEAFRSITDLKAHLAQPYTHVDGPLRQQFLRMRSDLPVTNTTVE